MFPSQALLSLILVSLAIVDASPLSRSTGKGILNFNVKFTENDSSNVLEKDRARIQTLKNVDQYSSSVGVTNTALIYTGQIGVGSPPTDYTLIIDTGSSNTWIGAIKAYTPTSTSHDTGNSVLVSYGSGNFRGEEWTDTVTLAPGLVIENQSIGVANSSFGFSNHGYDGILGVGPAFLTSRTVNNTNTVPTVSDNLLSQGTISEEVLGMYFVPASESTSTGSITFGGIDDSVTTSEVAYVPLTTTAPSSYYWGINQSISYGILSIPILSSTSGIVDTGTTLIYIASNAFELYQLATGAIMDPSTGLLTITPIQYLLLQPLSFVIGGISYDLSPNAQIWPRSLNSAIGGTSGSIYLVIANLGRPSGAGFDFINGYTFLERYYSVFDTTNKRVGFATTAYTDATTN